MSMEPEAGETSENELLRLGVDIVTAYVSRNKIAAEALPDLLQTVHGALKTLGPASIAPSEERPKPAVPISKSVQQDHIVCLEDGKKLKMLKRYLRSRFDMSPDDYRKRWGLPPDYPMVAPAYAARRSAFAKQIGLGLGVRRGK
jgi:predicted transcriptional regulator